MTMNLDEARFLIIAMGLLGAMLAVGAVLLIKIARRRHVANAPSGSALDTGVPARRMSRRHARRLQRYYMEVFTVVLALLVMLAVWLLT